MGSLVRDYEVFLSFRGKDTRQGFTDVLYDYMDSAKIRVFKDDKAIRIGDKIDSIFKAIVNSKICIPIFSPNFVQSKYCLLEVAKMVELKKTIVPIFCDVTSDDVKLKTPLYANDFKKLEDEHGNNQVEKWKQALKDVVSYKGSKVGLKGYSQFCKEFVVEVLFKLRRSNLESQYMGSSWAGTFGAPVTVVGQEFVAPLQVDLIIREIHTLRRYDVTDSNGIVIFKIKNHLFTSSEELLDASGKTLVTMHQKLFHLSFNVHVFRGKSLDMKDLLFKVKYPKGLDEFKTNNIFTLHVYLAQNTNMDVWDYRLECCWSEKTCVIYAGNTNDMVAQMTNHNKGNVQCAVLGKSDFCVTVYPHIDYAFVVALLVSSGYCNWAIFV